VSSRKFRKADVFTLFAIADGFESGRVIRKNAGGADMLVTVLFLVPSTVWRSCIGDPAKHLESAPEKCRTPRSFQSDATFLAEGTLSGYDFLNFPSLAAAYAGSLRYAIVIADNITATPALWNWSRNELCALSRFEGVDS
jgi:hypothetical protein